MTDASLSVGIIIVVNNRKDDLIRLLESVSQLQYQTYEVLVIDNGSSEELGLVKKYPFVEYLRFENNIGFVSGMVSGLAHLRRQNRHDCFWILDSDLEVAPDSLTKLVEVMASRDDVGVAGCIIHNTFDREVIVEAGADVRLSSGVVIPRHCNERRCSFLDKIIEVDFIASGGGGSLIRAEALRKTGFHDERYHFLWEDTDFGLCLDKNGFQSVVVTDAVVYHPPFTEKRNANIYAYYGVRNPLLTVAKYASGWRLPCFLFGNLSRYLRIALLMQFSGCKGFAELTLKALYDFIVGRFGRADLVEIVQPEHSDAEGDLAREKQIILLGTGSREAIESAVTFARRVDKAQIILVTQIYRQSLLKGIEVDRVITYDDHATTALTEYLRVGWAIFRLGGCVINTDPNLASPLSYFGRRVYDWHVVPGRLRYSQLAIHALWKPAAAVMLGHLLALFFLPLVWAASLKHRMKPAVSFQ